MQAQASESAKERPQERPIGRRSIGRLTGRNRYSAILAKRRSARGVYLQVYLGESVKGAAMLGVGVSKAIARQANARNYMRRAVREELRQHAPRLPMIELVVLVRKVFDRHARAEVGAEIDELLVRLQLCAAP